MQELENLKKQCEHLDIKIKILYKMLKENSGRVLKDEIEEKIEELNLMKKKLSDEISLIESGSSIKNETDVD